jgi:hypothetical protein
MVGAKYEFLKCAGPGDFLGLIRVALRQVKTAQDVDRYLLHPKEQTREELLLVFQPPTRPRKQAKPAKPAKQVGKVSAFHVLLSIFLLFIVQLWLLGAPRKPTPAAQALSPPRGPTGPTGPNPHLPAPARAGIRLASPIHPPKPRMLRPAKGPF